MKILSIVTSGLQEDSITYNTWKIVEAYPKARKHTYEYAFFRNEIDTEKVCESVKSSDADLIVIQTSPFHAQISSQLQMFMEYCEDNKVFAGRNVTVFDTCMRLFDTLLNNSLEEMIKKAGGRYIPALSLGTSDILNEKISPYVISHSVGDYKPEKKGFIGSLMTNETKELAEKLMANPPEALIRAIEWLTVCERLITNNIPDTQPKVLVIRTTKDAPDFSTANSTSVCLADYKITGCDSCKVCYVPKKCRFNDDFAKIEEEMDKAEIIIYTGTLNCGIYKGGLYKRLLDRDVKNGLAPIVPKKPKAFGYLVTNMDDYSRAQFKEWGVGDCAYAKNYFLGVEHTDEESFLKMVDLAKIMLAENVMPPINHYSEKNGRYFADLAKNIPTILAEELKYFESVGAYVPIEADPHSRPATDPKEYKMSAHGRTTPYRMYAGALKTVKSEE